MIALVDYGAGNLTSVRKALGALGADIWTPAGPAELERASAMIVPGVGHFSSTARLDGRWRDAIRGARARSVPLLGICVGLQWLFEGSTEAPDVPGLGLMAGTCMRLEAFPDSPLPTPSHYILNSAGWTYSQGSPARYLAAISSTLTAYWKAYGIPAPPGTKPAPFTATAIDKASGKFRTREGLSSPMGLGYEYLDGDASGKVVAPNGVVNYGLSYDMKEDAVAAARQAREKLTAPSVKPGKYDLVLDPSHTWLTIHESVGHPLELDRVLGYEANYAGTSFATLDKREQRFQYGSGIVDIFADKTQPGSLGAVAYDDEGVKTKRWDLIRQGKLVDYQTIRDQAHILGKDESDGCCYADSWSSVQFQRMANVSLAPGKGPLSVADMIKDVENGIYIIGDGSFSIDQQRYNAQFGGQLFYEIKNGEITRMIEDVAYQIRTPEFWNACSAICDESDYRLGGSFFDGKGQPGQVSAVSHGSATARFDGINVINTARSLG